MTAVDQDYRDALLSDDVYWRLKDYVLNDVIGPSDRLNVNQLSQHFGVSVTPIREALIRLAAEHIVVSKPSRGFFLKEFVPVEQNEIRETLFCLIKYVVESRSNTPFQFSLPLTVPHHSYGHHMRRIMPSTLEAALKREALYEQLVGILRNDQFSELAKNLCERTRVSRMLWIEHRESAEPAEEYLRDLIRLFELGHNQEALVKVRRDFQAKTRDIRLLANARERILYQSYPLSRPSAGR